MPKRPNIDRPVALKLMLPETLRGRIDILLWSHVEGKVPYGAYNRFFIGLINEHFDKLKESVDVQP